MAQKGCSPPCPPPHRVDAPVDVVSLQDLRLRKVFPHALQRQIGPACWPFVEVDVASHSAGLQGLQGRGGIFEIFNCRVLDGGEVRPDVMRSCSNQLGLVRQPVDVRTAIFFLDTDDFCRSSPANLAELMLLGVSPVETSLASQKSLVDSCVAPHKTRLSFLSVLAWRIAVLATLRW